MFIKHCDGGHGNAWEKWLCDLTKWKGKTVFTNVSSVYIDDAEL